MDDTLILEIEPLCECGCNFEGKDGFEYTSEHCDFRGIISSRIRVNPNSAGGTLFVPTLCLGGYFSKKMGLGQIKKWLFHSDLGILKMCFLSVKLHI